MTREEAIAKLKNFAIHAYPNEEFLMAIRALEQEPCTDAISREAVIDIIEDVCPIYGNDYRYILREKVNELSSVTPQYTEAEIQRMQDLEFAEIQKAYEIGKDEGSSDFPNNWIPASQPPKASGRYIVTRHFFDNDFVEMANYDTDLHTVDKYDFPKHKAGWYNSDSEYGNYELDDIVAWMPRPEPYKARPTGAESEE